MGRPSKIDRGFIKGLVTRFVELLEAVEDGTVFEEEDTIHGFATEIVTVTGIRKPIEIYALARTGESTHTLIEGDGYFGIDDDVPDEAPSVVVYVNHKVQPNVFAVTEADKETIYGVLVHELTHAAEYNQDVLYFPKDDSNDVEYYNSKSEVKAYTRNIIEELRNVPFNKCGYLNLKWFMAHSPVWDNIQDYLTEKTTREIERSVWSYFALNQRD